MKKPIESNHRPATVAFLVLAGLLLVGNLARADEGPSGDQSSRAANVAKLSDEGVALYKARDYRHASEKFLQAYALDQDPNLLFNMARCYESMGDPDSAIEKYEAFLAKPDADSQGKRRATDAIRALRQARSKAAETAISTPPAAAETQGNNNPGRNGAPSEPETSSFFTAPVIVLGTGVLVAAVGAVAYAMGSSDHGQVTGSAGYRTPGQVDPLTETQARKLVQSGDSKKLIGVVGLAVGGALMATSAALFAMGHHPDRETREGRSVAFGISPTGNGGQFLLEGRF